MRKLLNLQHHRHTGKRLPHHHTSYQVIFLLLSLAGMLLAGAQYATTHADDLQVTAKISAAVPSVPAQIASPTEAAQVNNPSVVVTGTCEVLDPAVIVAIYQGNEVLGSTICQNDGTFSVQVPLHPGSNTLVAKTLNITDDYGPDSALVTIIYKPKETPQPTPGASEPSNPLNSTPTAPGRPDIPLSMPVIRSKAAFITFGPNKPARWEGSFDGGKPPYNLAIDWGDGTKETKTNLGAEKREFTHRYRRMITFFVIFTLKDTAGQSVAYHFSAVTPYTTVPPVTTPATTSGISAPVLYASYGTTVAVGVLTWYHAQITALGFVHAHASLLKKPFGHIGRWFH